MAFSRQKTLLLVALLSLLTFQVTAELSFDKHKDSKDVMVSAQTRRAFRPPR